MGPAHDGAAVAPDRDCRVVNTVVPQYDVGMAEMLTIRDLVKRFRRPDGQTATVVDVARFDLAVGAQQAVYGPSGSGKTTFLNLIAGIVQADGGVIEIDGRSLTGLGESARDALRATTIGYIFQTFNLLQGCTALENVELGMMFGRGADRARATHLLEQVGLKDHLHHRPRQLSVGQQQRVAVARAMANAPRLVLADEPTGNLDDLHTASALRLIRDLCRETGAALLLVSHSQSVLNQFDRVISFVELNRAAASAAAPGAD